VKSHEEQRREARGLALGILGTVAALLTLYVLVERPPLSCGLGYALSVGVGIPITYWWSEFLFWLLEKYVPRMAEQAAGRERIPWIAVMVGIFERILFTTLVAYDVSRGGSFIVA
jgi:hypothetical protein